MMYLLDTAALNSVILFKKKHNLNDARQRRVSLETLACELIKMNTQERINILSLNRFSGVQASLFTTFNRLRFNIKRIRQVTTNSSQEVKLRRCSSDSCKLFSNNNKYKNECEHYGNIFCLDHREKITTFICKKCIHD